MKNYELKAGDKIKVRIYGTNGKVIKTRNFDEIFTVCEENEKLGFYWTDEFAPFESFCNTKFVVVPPRFAELDILLKAECEKYEDDCNKCPYQKECEEYSKLYQKLER